MSNIEVNFDGLVGPTHHYAGLSIDNNASFNNRYKLSNPRKAALQGLEKMKFLFDRGFFQGVFPPQLRPNIFALRKLGFSGTEKQILNSVANTSIDLLSAFTSASSMWLANAATISPSNDSLDRKVHFTVANLNNYLHRSQEHLFNAMILKKIFHNEKFFSHHSALIQQKSFSDEGSANHMRISWDEINQGIQIFVYGNSVFNHLKSKDFNYRQTLEASTAISRLHQLDPNYTLFFKQNPFAIKHGVFHNDVIAVSNKNLLFYHEYAFTNQNENIDKIISKSYKLNLPFIAIEVLEKDVKLSEAISSYLFNSQILSKNNGKMIILVPDECYYIENIWNYLNKIIANDLYPIDEIQTINLHESMCNGGGPACLRLKVMLNQEQFKSINANFLLNDLLYEKLKKWINKYYRDQLCINDLIDVQLLTEVYQALDELTQILKIGSIYKFQSI
ncbi:N-succinylarginine dihydrolase [Candidatus Ishikawella capsulata]|uniref:N-succinylarginine dihydrolase n=1 Tax=Candidatus Ishikawella capsulata TaxID=168169 RepID=UPI0005977E54|nr:N-succinylarginine dihydrolase [Candidatus Ishikawaella capsulata]